LKYRRENALPIDVSLVV